MPDCPKLKNKEKEEKKYKGKSKDFMKRYHGRAHVLTVVKCKI